MSIRTISSKFRNRKEIYRFVQFATVGALGALLNIFILYLLTSNGVHYLISGAIAIELSFIFNFFINMAWTFEDVEFKSLTGVLMALLRDHGVRSVGMGVNLSLLWLFTDVLGLYYLLSQLVGAGIVAVWNFAGNILWTWDG